MIDQAKSKIAGEFAKAIRPLLRCMMTKFRIPYAMIEMELRETAIDIAEKHVNPQNSKSPEVARVAILTGMSPAALTQKRQKSEQQTRLPKYCIPEASIIDDWTTKPEWLDMQGSPLVLPISGPYGKKNFPTLVRKCLGSIGHRHILKQLESANCVKLTMSETEGKPKTAVELIKRTFTLPIGESVDVFCQSLHSIYHHATTVSFNTSASDRPPSERHFQQILSSRRISPDSLSVMRITTKHLLNTFVSKAAKEISKIEKTELKKNNQNYPLVGLNLSYFEDYDADSPKYEEK